ncbi:lantibiotic dehydratase C-terminal domain-containing protein [Streptomyces sp. RPT161]|uniref:lantibiotic dehydratase C-terminal domain-containing protein n=1 Tax=Streptomyces sp. RPT161 TaxID=3015993 RepID=UPI0022B9370B|nr:lantibiotic dehydratase C-terminal domain-containing protein [Streptomyces sp. RPT161]
MTGTDLTWLSAHVFYHGNADQLVTEAVLPMFDELLSQGLLRRRFFLRHWERGPHLRVRLQVEGERAEWVRSWVQDRITGYLTEHPGPAEVDPERLLASLRKLSLLEHGSDADPELHTAEPANTLRWIDYVPELAKYGGPAGVAIAEDVFDVSSMLAGQVLRQVGSDNARLGIALQLLLITSRSLGLDEAARIVFLRSYQERWQGYLPDAPKMFAAWARQYDHQRTQYESLVADLVEGRPIGKGLGEHWEHTMDAAVAQLRPLVADGSVWPSDVDRSAPPFVAIAALLCQYLHTTNNRMNVRPQGECFVAYLAHRAVTESVSRPHALADAARKD